MGDKYLKPTVNDPSHRDSSWGFYFPLVETTVLLQLIPSEDHLI